MNDEAFCRPAGTVSERQAQRPWPSTLGRRPRLLAVASSAPPLLRQQRQVDSSVRAHGACCSPLQLSTLLLTALAHTLPQVLRPHQPPVGSLAPLPLLQRECSARPPRPQRRASLARPHRRLLRPERACSVHRQPLRRAEVYLAPRLLPQLLQEEGCLEPRPRPPFRSAVRTQPTRPPCPDKLSCFASP